MKGCRPLTEQELELAFSKVEGREQLLMAILTYTGFRVSEVLSIRIEDIDLANNRLGIRKRHTKGKIEARSSVIHPELHKLLSQYTHNYTHKYLFENPKTNKPISRIQAHRLLRKHLPKGSNMGLHTFRKFFAEKMYESFDKDLIKTSKALGHTSILNTAAYLSFDEKELQKAIFNLSKFNK